MLVQKEQFNEVVGLLASKPILAPDTETTGLRVHHEDRLFSVIIADEFESYYFDFQKTLPREWIKELSPVFKSPKILAFANAKFDMHMLAKEGVEVASSVWDVLVIAKCLYNQHLQYSLDKVAERYGYEKLKTVDDYIKKNRLYTIAQIPGKKKKTTNPHFDKVPLEIMQTYAERDARITFDICKRQMGEVQRVDDEALAAGQPPFWPVINRECEFTKVCFEMERTGMMVDHDFIRRAIEHEEGRIRLSKERYRGFTGRDFIDSNKALSESFSRIGVEGGRTGKGNASFTDDVLAKIDHPLAETVREYRDATKRLNSYYRSFLYHVDSQGAVHPNIKQVGADTFRLSITDPALQTLNSEEEGEFLVRNSFRARPGFKLVSIDYKAQEMGLTYDYSGAHALITKVKEGADPHQATAEMMSATRSQAKDIGFGLVYGMGIGTLAAKLKASIERAKILKGSFFGAIPEVKAFIREVTDTAKRRGYIFNWAGRRLYFPDPQYAYKATNYLIQSSGAEIMRCALIEIHKFLRGTQARILLSIHDEILVEIPETQINLVSQIQGIMISVYKPRNGLPMSTSVAIGERWGELEDYNG